MKKRGDGEGTIFQLPNGRWKVIVTVGWKNGKRVCKTRTLKKRSDAVAVLAEMRFSSGQFTPGEDPTLSQLSKRFMDYLKREGRAEKTISSYSRSLDRIIPELGSKKLSKVTRAVVLNFMDKLSEEDVGGRTRQIAFEVLRAMLNFAVHRELLFTSPMNKLKSPEVEPKEIDPFTDDECRLLLSLAEGKRYHAAVALGAGCGLRVGEILGLHWDNVDLKRRNFTVVWQATQNEGVMILRKPKSAAGKRTIDLPDFVYTALVDHKARLLASGKLGELVFPSAAGTLQAQSNFRKNCWVPLLKRAKLRHRGIHHLRHTYATLALEAGTPILVVSKILGHYSPSITLDFYGHILDRQNTAAAKSMNSLLG